MLSGFLSGLPIQARSWLLPCLVAGSTTGGVKLIQQQGGLQAAELWICDTWVRLGPDRGPDARLLLVAITEQIWLATAIRCQESHPIVITLEAIF